ncbi:MAG: hypothetical protein RMZ41_013705 [Nostoc sp. DedVER02]|uniref:hypothetical protein n=1 Tax=unclassified Nostoc TaxID=2593658 RepID=UPI002AD433D7|nr:MULTISPECIES: hypothetical protein [unclassified Nostoc]MDZ7989615.1 hypothetical protein [Nostoc sp. DedVER02]MDZ8113691.1 hypothetical protein [Nostoc sp. DedVER01b]
MKLSGNDYLDHLNDYAKDLKNILDIIDTEIRVIADPKRYQSLRSRVKTLERKIFKEITKVKNTPEPEGDINMFNKR